MLVLGVYTTVLTSISGVFTWPIDGATWHCVGMLIPVGLGCIVGLIFGSKLVDVLIRKQPQATYFAILGLVVGSLLAVFPKDSLALTLNAHRAGSAGGSGFRRLQVFENLTRLDIFRRCGILPEDIRSVWLPARYRTADFQAGGRPL